MSINTIIITVSRTDREWKEAPLSQWQQILNPNAPPLPLTSTQHEPNQPKRQRFHHSYALLLCHLKDLFMLMQHILLLQVSVTCSLCSELWSNNLRFFVVPFRCFCYSFVLIWVQDFFQNINSLTRAFFFVFYFFVGSWL